MGGTASAIAGVDEATFGFTLAASIVCPSGKICECRHSRERPRLAAARQEFRSEQNQEALTRAHRYFLSDITLYYANYKMGER